MPDALAGQLVAVYPRVCGGTHQESPIAARFRGLSPRVRGNLSGVSRSVYISGSIPACAGEPQAFQILHPPLKVYPRVCGGTSPVAPDAISRTGLSPRVRGNPGGWCSPARWTRSIPACAGEPVKRPRTPPAHTVYPRVCGGTIEAGIDAIPRAGLSPRVRGNRADGRLSGGRLRSIPACAGEPARRHPASRPATVYPRVCGGTENIPHNRFVTRGLSPRVRGNRYVSVNGREYQRSIPACAGEPSAASGARCGLKVYPRVCGGTPLDGYGGNLDEGLSPRVRGNPPPCPHRPPGRRSIPACAGEPRTAASAPARRTVYPRVCGGTSCPPPQCAGMPGLSPRVRGNRYRIIPVAVADRSIPACAGEPLHHPVPGRRNAVYPRVCGGTRWPGGRK